MNRKIILGCILAVSLLLLVPSIPALESNQVREFYKTRLLNRLKDIDIEELRNRLKDIDIDELKERFKSSGKVNDNNVSSIKMKLKYYQNRLNVFKKLLKNEDDGDIIFRLWLILLFFFSAYFITGGILFIGVLELLNPDFDNPNWRVTLALIIGFFLVFIPMMILIILLEPMNY